MLAKYLSITATILLFIAGSIKSTESFFEGALRFYTPLTSLFSNNNSLIVIISVSIMILILLSKLKELELKIEKIRIVFFFVVFKIVLLFSLISNSILSLKDILGFILLIMQIIWIACYLIDKKEILNSSIVLFSTFFILLNAFEFYMNSASVFWAGRLYGVTNHPNFLGGYSALLSIFILKFILSSDGTAKRFFHCFVWFCLMLLVLYSGSRSSLACLIIGSLLIIVKYYQAVNKSRKKYIFLVFVSLFLPMLVSIILYFSSQSDMSRLLLTENTREEINIVLLNVFYMHPIFGNPAITDATSNSILLALASTGIIGFIFLLYSLMSLLIFSYRILLAKYSFYLESFTYSIFIVAFIFYSCFEGVLVESFSLGQTLFVISSIMIFSKGKVS